MGNSATLECESDLAKTAGAFSPVVRGLPDYPSDSAQGGTERRCGIEHLVRDEGGAGSNPATPISKLT